MRWYTFSRRRQNGGQLPAVHEITGTGCAFRLQPDARQGHRECSRQQMPAPIPGDFLHKTPVITALQCPACSCRNTPDCLKHCNSSVTATSPGNGHYLQILAGQDMRHTRTSPSPIEKGISRSQKRFNNFFIVLSYAC
jgi:hypothetical protein